MDNRSINDRFRSISYIILHFSCSLIELICALAILGFQITLTITETCAYRIGVGFWSFPCLLLSPISIWILLWKRNCLSCLFTFLFHLVSTLFASAVLIISLLTLVKLLESVCSTSTSYFLSMNICLIAVSVLLKIFLYGEILLLYFLRHQMNNASIRLDKQMKLWSLSRTIGEKNEIKTKHFEI